MQGTRGAIRTGGDDGGGALEGSPPAQKPLALYSGIVEVKPDGTAEVVFDIPAFAGTARVMGVAWSKDRVGKAVGDVIIRDPVVVTATLPRFLNTGDKSTLHARPRQCRRPGGRLCRDACGSRTDRHRRPARYRTSSRCVPSSASS